MRIARTQTKRARCDDLAAKVPSEIRLSVNAPKPTSIQRDVRRRTTSLVLRPRERNSLEPSGDHEKLKIRPEVYLVSCFGFPPASRCSQMFVTPSWVAKYCNCLPSRDQWTI